MDEPLIPPDSEDCTDLDLSGELADLVEADGDLYPRFVRVFTCHAKIVHIFEPIIPARDPNRPNHAGYVWHAYVFTGPFSVSPSRRNPDGSITVGRVHGAGELIASSTVSIDDAAVKARAALAPKDTPRP